MSSSWDEFLPSKIRTLGVVGRFCAKIHHDTPLKPQFDYFWNFGLECDFRPKFLREATLMNFEVRNIIFGVK